MGDIFCDKRTRSQLTLPDDIYQHLPLSRSPLKDARTALRNQSEPPIPSWLNEGAEDESEDEILLSPTKAKSVKRSASPSRDTHHSSNIASFPDFPALKRPRRDDGVVGNSDSENVNMPSSPNRHFAQLNLDSPKRVGDGSPSKEGLTPRRAHSVPPMFPSIDLRNPPSSPNKPRSPRKVTPMLKFTILVQPTKMESIPDEETQQEDGGQGVLLSLNPAEQAKIAGEVAESSQFKEDPANSLVVNTHKTPARMRLTPGPLSPLTPLPETPILPPQLHGNLEDRMPNASSSGFEKNSNVSNNTNVHPEPTPTSHPPLETGVCQGCLPRSSNASENALDPSMPIPGPSHASSSMPPLVQDPTSSAHVKSHAPVVPRKKSAFDIIMNASQSTTVKGKGKAPASSAAPSASKSIGKSKNTEQPVPKQSLKSRMRPKEVPQPRREAIPDTDIRADGEGKAGPSGSRPSLPMVERAAEPHAETEGATNSDLESLFDETKAASNPEADAVVKDPTSKSANPEDPPPTAVSDERRIAVEMPRPSRLAVPKKRARTQASSIPRVTRSSSLKKKEQDAERASQDPRVRKKSLLGPKTSPKSPSKSAHTSVPAEPANRERSSSPLTDPPSDSAAESSAQPVTDATDVPKTPRPSNNFARPTLSSLAKTPAKAAMNLSPTKLGRSASMFARPIGGLMPSKPTNGSALSNLSSALDKLAWASTSSHRTHTLSRSSTFGSAEMSVASSSKSTTASLSSSKPTLAQRSVTDFFKKDALPRPGRLMSGTGGVHRGRPGIFPYRTAPKVSQKTPLPVVPASPVKGSGDLDGDLMNQMIGIEQTSGSAKSMWESKVVASTPEAMELSELVGAHLVKGKRKAVDETDGWSKNASRRASTAFNMLSQSIPPPPPPNVSGDMGPPATPPKREGLRSSTSTHPSAPSSDASSSAARKPNGLGLKRTPSTNDDDEEVGRDDKSYSYSGRKVSGSKKPADPSLSILSGIKVYVDVRDSNGIDCGDVFTDMLKRLGAKVMKNFGSTCTHLVFKDGTVGTLNRYRQLENKPFVVGLQWIVECAEKLLHLDETQYAISLEGVNIAGVNKRARKSMIPKPIASTRSDDLFSDSLVADSSVDESNSSFSIDSSLKPLEIARRRQSTVATSRS
ncbi:uncharacterized protein EV420DRAFT_1762381 [Desarmillaria tabescens]|uniref:BRCT domain-containing protein n=1 Tax=Armillaria tabescens TaxID=1929756 RepID=A0AA39TNL8_ARMTA|nr:uncharacterized protein EV420DRAFT_1762381 [Desarmillaria tabescens]KAK0461053.1 hypothetical protein EV420DRAFT_1762381 [Desarmillaria tabescens]